MIDKLTHFDKRGNAVMVDVSDKETTSRTAIAKGKIIVNTQVMEAIVNRNVEKGDVLGTARIAGIMGSKQTAALIPMCHPLAISKSSIDFEIDKENRCIIAVCTTKVEGKTGVEMESLTGVSVALLTIYDMCKAIDKTMEITEIHLVSKSGGKSGEFINPKNIYPRD